MRILIAMTLLGVTVTRWVEAQSPGLAALLKSTQKPVESSDWKLFKDGPGKLSLLLPRGYFSRNAPEGETTTTLYCTAGGSLKDYRLVKVVSEKDTVLPEPTATNLPAFATMYLEKQLALRLKDVAISERAVVEAAGKPAFLLAATGTTMGGFRSSVVTIVMKSGDLVHHVSLSCLEENLEKYSEEFAKIISSTKVLP